MTTIEWTHGHGKKGETWNPITGCSKVSAGCAHCYAETIANRFWGDRKFTDVQFHPERLKQPLKWRKPRMVFVNSMSDWLHDAVTDEQIFQILGVASVCRHHTMQFLTKRPERLAILQAENAQKEIFKWGCHWANEHPQYKSVPWQWPLPNVWLGVTCENQKAADERIPLLLQTPAAVRFLSCEPLLEEIDLRQYLGSWCKGESFQDSLGVTHHKAIRGVDWVIVGGESGHGARPCNIEWIRSIVEQCREADVACFVKQLGTNPTSDGWSCASNGWAYSDRPRMQRGKGGNPEEWPEDLQVREYPKVGCASVS